MPIFIRCTSRHSFPLSSYSHSVLQEWADIVEGACGVFFITISLCLLFLGLCTSCRKALCLVYAFLSLRVVLALVTVFWFGSSTVLAIASAIQVIVIHAHLGSQVWSEQQAHW